MTGRRPRPWLVVAGIWVALGMAPPAAAQLGAGVSLLDADINALSFSAQYVWHGTTTGALTLGLHGALDFNLLMKETKPEFEEVWIDGRFLHYRHRVTGQLALPASAQHTPDPEMTASMYAVADWKRLRLGPGIALHPTTRIWQRSALVSFRTTRVSRVGVEIPRFPRLKAARIRIVLVF